MLNFFVLLCLSYSPFALTIDEFIYTRGKRELTKSIYGDENCEEVRKICSSLNDQDDLSTLECLLATNPERLKNINKQCQTIIKEHKKLLLQDSNVKNYLNPVCGSELKQLPCKDDSSDTYGHYLKCIINNLNDIQSNDCYQALLHLENVALRDDRFIKKFIEHCDNDIRNLGCVAGDPDSNSPTALSCLQEKIMLIKNEYCKKEVFRISEVQSNNIKMDVQLYIDCSNDVSRYCANLSPGTGMVIPCLMQQFLLDHTKFQKTCAQHLIRRQKLIAADFSVSKGLLKSCKDDIKKGNCRKRQNSGDKTVRLAQILLCLENLMRNGTKVDSDCSKEMVDHRRMLMEDYRLSPEIVNSCKNETQFYCKKYEFGGKTIHCLMNQALIHSNSVTPRLSNPCLRALEDLVKKADVGENWSVDPVLHEACDPVVKVACKNVKSGNARVISCLMDSVRSDAMTEECENALTEIQYFVSRDFKLDPKLYKACQQDASVNCHYFDPSESENGPSFSSQVLPCLYRLAYQSNNDRKISHPCLTEIQRVMRQRAISVDLEPEIEEVCVRDLGTFCKDKSKKGEEMQCLQDNMEDLGKDCHEAVESFTEIEAQHVELNPFISKYCSKIIETLCKPENSDEDGGVMDCLVENKNNPLVKSNPACRGSIEHFQIISLKDFRFTYKFKMACKPYAMRLCANRAGTKSEVVACLSEHILNATIQRVKSSISKDCRQQLKTQIFQQKEKISLDPILKKACTPDIKKFCEHVQVGNAQILECLQTQKDLTSSCAKEVFKIQKLEVYDNSLDFALQTLCAGAIDQFCPHDDKNAIFECLKLNKDEKGFNQNCREIVKHRLMEQNMNNFLNPSLQKKCQMDISKFCKKDIIHMDEKNIGDSVIKCLKTPLKRAQLSTSCEKEVLDILRDRALDVNLNPMIRSACKLELETICKVESDESGKVEECLKVSYINKNIPTTECKQEVANMIEESKTDIQVDPILQRACAFDLLALCNKVEQGNGRHIKCLKSVMESGTQSLSPKCKAKLQERLIMYKSAAQETVDDLTDLAQQVYSSPAKNYLVIMLFVMISGIFLIGVFCGRTFRRNYRVLKNK